MCFFSSLEFAASGLAADRMRVDLATTNLANANSTRTAAGGPYRRQDPALRAVGTEGTFSDRLSRAFQRVRIDGVVSDQKPPREVFNPSHPDANEDGVVLMPNVDTVEEMVNLMNAQRSFDANVSVIQASREMAQRALRIGR